MKKAEEELKKIERKVAMVVFPHPDDETVWVGGLMQRMIKSGWEVVVISVTNGIRGQLHIHGRGRSMMQIRREEMNVAMGRLGVAQFSVWSHDDGTLRRGKKWRKDLREVLGHYRPGLVVSYDFSGMSGHPDHIALSLELFELVKRMRSVRLWWPSLSNELKERLLNGSLTKKYLNEPNIELKIGLKELYKKYQAIKAHESQNLQQPMSWTLKYRREYFVKADLKINYKYEYRKFKID